MASKKGNGSDGTARKKRPPGRDADEDMEEGASAKWPKVGCQTSTPALVKHVPKLPRLPHEGVTMPTESFASVAETFQRKQARRDAASRGLQAAVRESAVAVHALHRGDLHTADSALAAADAALQASMTELGEEAEAGIRYGPLSGAMESVIKAKALAHFLRTGALLRRSDVCWASYDEYIPGVIAFANELQRYVVKQARERNVESLVACKLLVEDLQAQLMLFDFRNGPLRHKFDSIKYVVRKLEDTAFELSLQDGLDVAQAAAAPDTAQTVLDADEFDAMRTAMEDNDAKRERVIKECRDLQKASKNSIYDLHRGNLDKAEAALGEVKGMALQLLPTVEDNKSLRNGGFSGVLEEYCEGMLFLQFLRDGSILSMEDLAPANGVEYLGGLLDMTGEVGRYAVAAATRRDVGAVLKCEDTVDQILGRVLVLPGLPGAMLKKTEVAKATLRKLDNMLYELSLSRKSSSTEPDAGVGGDASKGGGGSAGGLGASGPGET